jgi:hypothetical protein
MTEEQIAVLVQAVTALPQPIFFRQQEKAESIGCCVYSECVAESSSLGSSGWEELSDIKKHSPDCPWRKLKEMVGE